MALIVKHPDIPHIGPILGSLIPEKWLKIRGVVPAKAFKFNIWLQYSGRIIMQNNVALQFSVSLQNNNISLNSNENGNKWNEGKLMVGVPIKHEEKFEVGIICNFSHYKMYLNNSYCCDFPQKITCDRISHVVIDGDIFLITQISYKLELSSLATPPFYNAVDMKTPSVYESNSLMHSSIPAYSTIITLPPYSPYPVRPEIHATPSETIISINNTSSNFSVHSSPKKCSIYICLLVLVSVLIGASLVAKIR